MMCNIMLWCIVKWYDILLVLSSRVRQNKVISRRMKQNEVMSSSVRQNKVILRRVKQNEVMLSRLNCCEAQVTLTLNRSV